MIRVLRLIEYVYVDVATMEADMARWSLQGQKEIRDSFNNVVKTFKSVTLPLEVFDDKKGKCKKVFKDGLLTCILDEDHEGDCEPPKRTP